MKVKKSKITLHELLGNKASESRQCSFRAMPIRNIIEEKKKLHRTEKLKWETLFLSGS